MYNEIGSNFWCDINKVSNSKQEVQFKNIKSIDYRDISYLDTGRSAIRYVIEHIDCEIKKALLPAYTCHTVIQPFVDNGYEVEYYNLNKSLNIDIVDFENKIISMEPSTVLLHSYYGFDTSSDINEQIIQLREKGIIVIEDLTQTLFSNINHVHADYYVGSFRKWLAVPDGGFAINTKGKFKYKPTVENRKLIKSKLQAFEAKNLYMEFQKGEKAHFIKSYKDAENIIDGSDGIFNMSNESKMIFNELANDELKYKRIKNFELLLENIVDNTKFDLVFKTLPKGVIPLYFPIYVKEDRSKLQSYLAKNEIYAPIIWPKPDMISEKVNTNTIEVYNEILALPCDQRYGIEEMRKIVQVLFKYGED